MVSEKFSLKNRKFCTENRMYSSFNVFAPAILPGTNLGVLVLDPI